VDIHPSRNLPTDYGSEVTDDLTRDKGDWLWAAADDGPAGDRFVIVEGGEDALWARVHREIGAMAMDVSWRCQSKFSGCPGCVSLGA
jgi:hypothetical protein